MNLVPVPRCSPPRRAWRTVVGAAGLAITALLSACGGSDSGSADTTPPPVVAAPVGDPVAQTVGAAGGTVDATASGVKVRLSFPAGALAADTRITVAPQAPAAGDLVSVRLAPGSVFFAQPVTLVLEFPAGTVPDAKASLRQQLGGADSFLATSVDPGARTLTARLTTFGGAALDALAKPAAAPAGRARALRARALDAPPPGDGTVAAAATTSLADMIASIRRQVTILENVGDFEAAFALQASIASLLNRRGDIDFAVTATPFIKEAHDTACAALSAAMADARTAQITQLSQFKPLREKIGNWWVIADQTDLYGSGCPGATIEDFSAAAIDLTQRELALQKQKLAEVRTGVESLVNQAKIQGAAAALKIARQNKSEFEALEAAAAILALPPLPPQTSDRARATRARLLAVHDSGYAALIQSELIDPLLTPAREAAWTLAKGSATLAQYPGLIDAFGSAPPLLQDLQFVLTRINARSIDVAGNTLASSTMGFEVVPALPADPKRSDTITLHSGDTLALSGNIANLECAAAGEETLQVSFEGVPVASVNGSGGNLLAGALATLTRTGLLASAGLPPDDSGNHPLLIRRSVSPCAAALGLTDDLLATLTLRFGAAPRLAYMKTPRIEPDHHADEWILQSIAQGGGALNTILTGTTAGCAGCAGQPAGPLSWSPDGKRLAYAGFTAATSTVDIWVARADGSGATRVPGTTGARSPNWTPDGSKFVIAAADGGIATINIDGTGLVALTTGSTDDAPVLSADGQRIFFVRNDAGGNPVFMAMNADGSGLAVLGLASGYRDLTLSPDGRQLAYIAGVDSGWKLMVANVDGSAPREVLFVPRGTVSGGILDGKALHGPLSWSPEGKQIAFVLSETLILGPENGVNWDWVMTTSSIWVVNADGSGLTERVHGDRYTSYGLPAWSR